MPLLPQAKRYRYRHACGYNYFKHRVLPKQGSFSKNDHNLARLLITA